MADEFQENDSETQGSSLSDEIRSKRNADKGREPQLVPGRMGRRMVSLAALLERIVAAFVDEHGADSPALLEADTETKRLKLLLGTVDYVLAVESITFTSEEKADLMRRAYAELFTYGPLDVLLKDERVTTILLEGSDKAAVRYGHGDLTALAPIFEDEAHLRQVMRRLLLDAGTDFRPEQSLIEVGLRVDERPICVNLALPPVTFQLTADIRVHPKQLPTLEELTAAGMMNAESAQLIKAIAQSSHGLVIVGESESGKTTLLGVLAALIPKSDNMVAVERAGELQLSEGITRLVEYWGYGEKPPVSFGEQIGKALKQNPSVILLDEVRADEPQAFTPLLTAENAPRQLWAFRGTADSKRLASGLSMVARRGDPTHSEALVRSLYERLPFIITLRRTKERLQVRGIAEWQFRADSEYPDFVELMSPGWEGMEFTGKRPSHPLDLPDNFWR